MKTLVYFILAILLASVNGEMFTSVEQLANNLLAEEKLVKSLEVLIASEEARLRDLKEKFTFFKSKNAEVANPEAYLANPINAFQLIKRLTLELTVVETMAAQNGYPEFLRGLKELRKTILPTEEDLIGAGAALIRLQDTYDLKTADFSEGVLSGRRYNATLSADDCLEIGMQAYNAEDFYHAVLWLREAFRKVELNADADLQMKETILAYLAPSFYKSGLVKLALAVTKLMVALNPDNLESRKDMQLLMIEVAKLNEKTGEWEVGGLDFRDIHLDRKNFDKDPKSYDGVRRYELLCQGKTTPPTPDQFNLSCRYIDDRNAFLKIAPLKVEEVRRNPDILLFHEVISDSEIEEIKQLALQKLKRATISDRTGADKPAVYRISKSGWLKDSESDGIRTLSRRVEDMTGMTVDTAEELQVVNYGIGGQYVPHFDFARNPEKSSFSNTGLGNRVSTVLFYMSDVEQGGGTVFPLLNVGVSPRKGTAVFWYNLHKTGEMDFRTLHAGCPVLVGNKWICNKWQHIVGQERHRPCDLQPDFPLADPKIRA